MKSPIRIGVLGAGYWGPNVIRNLLGNQQFLVTAVCDQDSARRQHVQKSFPQVTTVSDFNTLLKDPDLDAIAIVTDISSHEALGLQALRAGKHVFMEKPLAATPQGCRRLIDAAKKQQRILMVGHTFLYNSAVRKLKEYLQAGSLGELFYMQFQRLNLGRVQYKIGSLYSLASHDVSIAMYLLDQRPISVKASGYYCLNKHIDDACFVMLEFPGGNRVQIHASWLHPEKIRKVTLVGSNQMIVYDDVSADAKLSIYHNGIARVQKEQANPKHFKDFSEFQYDVRSGDLHIPRIQFKEPLAVELQHFADCIQTNQKPLSDGVNGWEVVKVLEAAQKSLKQDGKRIKISWK